MSSWLISCIFRKRQVYWEQHKHKVRFVRTVALSKFLKTDENTKLSFLRRCELISRLIRIVSETALGKWWIKKGLFAHTGFLPSAVDPVTCGHILTDRLLIDCLVPPYCGYPGSYILSHIPTSPLPSSAQDVAPENPLHRNGVCTSPIHGHTPSS